MLHIRYLLVTSNDVKQPRIPSRTSNNRRSSSNTPSPRMLSRTKQLITLLICVILVVFGVISYIFFKSFVVSADYKHNHALFSKMVDEFVSTGEEFYNGENTIYNADLPQIQSSIDRSIISIKKQLTQLHTSKDNLIINQVTRIISISHSLIDALEHMTEYVSYASCIKSVDASYLPSSTHLATLLKSEMTRDNLISIRDITTEILDSTRNYQICIAKLDNNSRLLQEIEEIKTKNSKRINEYQTLITLFDELIDSLTTNNSAKAQQTSNHIAELKQQFNTYRPAKYMFVRSDIRENIQPHISKQISDYKGFHTTTTSSLFSRFIS